MELSKQVCSLELAQKLKELGVKQESLFYWVADELYFKTNLGSYTSLGRCISDTQFEMLLDSLKSSAFTVAELGEMLPEEVLLKGEYCSIEMVNTKWYKLRALDLDKTRMSFEADTEADARAKMLIYLIENKLIML